MNRDAIIFACANPTPEIMPDEAKAAGAAVVCTGAAIIPIRSIMSLRSRQYSAARSTRERPDINSEMKIAAAEALASLVSDEELNADYILPLRLLTSACARRSQGRVRRSAPQRVARI